MIIEIFEKKKPPQSEEQVPTDYESVREKELTKHIETLRGEIALLKAERMGDDYSRRKALRLMDVSIVDPIPADAEQRKAYVREVAQFFTDYGEKKFLQLISFVREELDWSGLIDNNHSKEALNGLSRDQYDWLMRGTSNGLKLLLDWGKEMQSEHAANLQAEKEALTHNTQ